MPNLFDSDLSDPIHFILITGVMFITIIGRYFIIAGLFFFSFSKKASSNPRKINLKKYPAHQFIKEIKWSAFTSFIFAATGACTVFLWQKGHTAFYKDIHQYGYFYLLISIVIYMLVHDAYYYWTHRLMHHPKAFRFIHIIHHKSYIPSPWTAFSFHPFESILEALILPLMILFIPIHHYALLIYLTIMTFSSVINHLDIELFPDGFGRHWLGKWFIGATHHSLHHSQMKHNYGFYFTFWDKWLKTESPDFIPLFQSKSAGTKNEV